jgi:hypothetical protein
MSYQRADGRYVYTEQFKVPGTVVTASGNSPAVDVGSANVLRGISVTAAAVGGTTPSLTILPQSSPDGTTWTAIGSAWSPAITANGTTAKASLTLPDRYFRLNYTVTGTTPTVTLTVTGDLV